MAGAETEVRLGAVASPVVVTSKTALTPPTVTVAWRVVFSVAAEVRRTEMAFPELTEAEAPTTLPFTKITGEPAPVTVAVKLPSNPESVARLEVTFAESAWPVAGEKEKAPGVKSPVVTENKALDPPMARVAREFVLSRALVVRRTRSVSPVKTVAEPDTKVPFLNICGLPSPVTLTRTGSAQPERVTVSESTAADKVAWLCEAKAIASH